MIRCILNATITKSVTTGQSRATVHWLDRLDHPGETTGPALGHSMQMLLLRAIHEGHNIQREEF